MNRKLLPGVIALIVGFSACNDGNLPTEGARDLLRNPSDVPALGESKYGHIFDEEVGGDTVTVLDTVDVSTAEEIPDTVDVSEAPAEPAPEYHITDGPLRSQRRGYPVFHLIDGPKASEYSYAEKYHIADGPKRSSYNLYRHVYHVLDGPRASAYTTRPMRHVTSGGSRSAYINPYHEPRGPARSSYVAELPPSDSSATPGTGAP